jgi:Zn-dependent protease with chaperone function
MAYIAATIAMIIGVTAIVGFAAFSYSDAGLGYNYTVGQFIRSQAPLLSITAVVTAVFIFGSSLYKTSVLSAGGGQVASEMGGTLIPTDVQDPLRRRLRNIVEEMAIASGVPVPEIYVLEEEPGINAFAAGFSTSDAAIAVTRGTLELLDRNELQGVIAHEFSHILNGDMKLNVRLMGVLFGIMALGLIGRMIIRGGYHSSLMSSRRDRGHPVIFIVGIGLTILGGIGVFFARAIKASVSRQREFLADASAVQFTRQSEGIANALKKIGGYSEGSKINVADPEQVHWIRISRNKTIHMSTLVGTAYSTKSKHSTRLLPATSQQRLPAAEQKFSVTLSPNRLATLKWNMLSSHRVCAVRFPRTFTTLRTHLNWRSCYRSL